MIHERENEGEWVLPGSINANERHEGLAIIVEAAACQRFLVQPLQITFGKRDVQLSGRTSDSPSRRVGSSMRNGT